MGRGTRKAPYAGCAGESAVDPGSEYSGRAAKAEPGIFLRIRIPHKILVLHVEFQRWRFCFLHGGKQSAVFKELLNVLVGRRTAECAAGDRFDADFESKNRNFLEILTKRFKV